MKKKNSNETNETFKILGFVVIFFIVMYFITGIITGEIKFNKKEKPINNNVVIQYQEILAGEIFIKPEDEYYVIIYDFDSDNASLIKSIINNYLYKEEETIKIYEVNLNNHFNKIMKEGENSLVTSNNIKELRIKEPTLIKVKNNKNDIAIEGIEAIKEKLE